MVKFVHHMLDAGGMPRRLDRLPPAPGAHDLAVNAIMALGWIEIVHEPGRIRLKLAPGRATEMALSMARVVVGAAGVPIGLMLSVGDGWQCRKMTAVEAVDWLARLAVARRVSPVLMIDPLSVASLFRDRSSGLIAMWQRLQNTPARLTLDDALEVVGLDADGRSGLIERSSDGRLAYRAISPVIRYQTQEARERLIGTPPAEVSEYDAQCVAAYRSIGDSPQVADVAGLVLRDDGAPVSLGHRIMRVARPSTTGSAFIFTTFEPRARASA